MAVIFRPHWTHHSNYDLSLSRLSWQDHTFGFSLPFFSWRKNHRSCHAKIVSPLVSVQKGRGFICFLSRIDHTVFAFESLIWLNFVLQNSKDSPMCSSLARERQRGAGLALFCRMYRLFIQVHGSIELCVHVVIVCQYHFLSCQIYFFCQSIQVNFTLLIQACYYN